jgi:hypothetical protein
MFSEGWNAAVTAHSVSSASRVGSGMVARRAQQELPQHKIRKRPAATLVVYCRAVSVILLSSSPARAQHGDWLLGTNGLMGGSQPPTGLHFQNLFSYYHTSGSGFVQSNLRCGPRRRVCLSANAAANGSLDLFVDFVAASWTSTFTILGAHYGLALVVPFALADASAGASLEPVLTLPRGSVALPARQQSGGTTKGSIANMYVEPVSLGWHFRHSTWSPHRASSRLQVLTIPTHE